MRTFNAARRRGRFGVEALEQRVLCSLSAKLPLLPEETLPPEIPTLPVSPPRIPTHSTKVGVPVFGRLGTYSTQEVRLASEISAPARVWTGLIDWNDGTTTRGRLARDEHNQIVLYGDDHVYAHPGAYSGLISLYEETVDPALGIPAQPGPDAVRVGYHHFAISVAPYTPAIYPELATPHAIAPVTGVSKWFLLGTLNDPHLKIAGEANAPTPLLTAQVDWGDKRRSAARLVRNSEGGIDIYAAHGYAKARSYTAAVTARLATGSPVLLFHLPVTVATESPGGTRLAWAAGMTMTGAVATLPQPEGYPAVNGVATIVVNPSNAAALEAMIAWGDGAVSARSLWQSAGAGRYEILGSHTYHRAGTYRVEVTVTESVPYGPAGAHGMRQRAYRLLQTTYSTARVSPLPQNLANSLRSF